MTRQGGEIVSGGWSCFGMAILHSLPLSVSERRNNTDLQKELDKRNNCLKINGFWATVSTVSASASKGSSHSKGK
jgi:hypothetical protein